MNREKPRVLFHPFSGRVYIKGGGGNTRPISSSHCSTPRIEFRTKKKVTAAEPGCEPEEIENALDSQVYLNI